MKKHLNQIGILILITIFILFFIIATFFLERRNLSKNVEPPVPIVEENDNYDNEIFIIDSLYQNVRIFYDVINNKFKVTQDDTITIGDVIYKKITNFKEVMHPLFTENGINNYIKTFENYFAYANGEYYLAGNLINYQTYYFRGDNTNIYVSRSTENEIDGIIYEKWTNYNKNTLATIKVVKENDTWLIDNINVLATE